MAVLLVLRRRLIDEHGATTAAELMLIDVAVLSYYHTLRINGWIGNFAPLIESEFFGTSGRALTSRTAMGVAATASTACRWSATSSASGSSYCRCWTAVIG